jgi:hypothetical protein
LSDHLFVEDLVKLGMNAVRSRARTDDGVQAAPKVTFAGSSSARRMISTI